jgi:hypothetical protein
MIVPTSEVPPDLILIPNRLREERLAAGIATPEEVAQAARIEPDLYRAMEEGKLLPRRDEFDRIRETLGGVEEDRLYITNYRQLIGIDPSVAPRQNDYPGFFAWLREAERLLVSKDEMTWLETRKMPDRPVDVFLSMSCGTQEMPHLLLDTVSVCTALGVNFLAAAGPAGCCGKPYLAQGNVESGEAWVWSKAAYAKKIGAGVQVNWCTACQATATTSAARRRIVEGRDHPVRETQLLTFLADRLEELGDRVPWTTTLDRRVVCEGHHWSPIHTEAWEAGARLLNLVPGVEVVGTYDGFSDESPCGWRAREKAQGPWTALDTPEAVTARRRELAQIINGLGADTVACQHQGCHKVWSPYAGDDLTVQHAVSILAEALGCAHPDRYQAAVRVANAAEIVDQTRFNWESWGLSEKDATALAEEYLVDSRFSAGVTACACGGGEGCGERLISIDVLRATARPARAE